MRRRVVYPLILALLCAALLPPAAKSEPAPEIKYYNRGGVMYQASEEYKEKYKKYQQAWENIRTRIAEMLKGLSFYPVRRPPIQGIPGSLDGSFRYGSQEAQIGVSLPRKKLTSPPRGERKLISESPREAKFNTSRLRVRFTPKGQIHSARNFNKRYREYAENPETVNEPRTFKESVWVFKDEKFQSESFESTFKRVAINKSYGGFPGEMFLKVQKGKTFLIEGEYARKRNYGWYGKGIDIDAPYDINAYFEYQDEEFPDDPTFQFGVRVTYGHTPIGWHPDVPRADESLISQITTNIAKILKEELGALGLPPVPVEEPTPEPEVIQVEDSKDDGYWTWLVPYVLQQEEFRRRVNEVRMELESLAEETDKLRNKWMKRLGIELEYDEGPGAEGPRMSTEVLRNNKRQRDQLRADISKIKAEQQLLIDEVLDALLKLQQSVEIQVDKNGDKRPGLTDELQRLKDQDWLLKVELYDAARWHNENEMLKLMEEFDFSRWDVPGVSLWYRAKARLAHASNLDRRLWLQQTSPTSLPLDMRLVEGARTLRLEALSDLRRLLRKHPNHEQARAMIQKQEIYWLKQVAAKLDKEKQLALAAFRQYLTERGFNADDKYGWWAGTTEFFATYFGLGPISLTAGLPGINVPGGLADSVGIIQMGAVKNQIAINIMIRLVQNGVPLPKIPAITPEQLAETLILNTKRNTPLPEYQARRMWREMKESFAEITVLGRLAADDPFYFAQDVNAAFADSFYIPIDSEYHWYEYFGDILSLRNVIGFFFPHTVLSKVNNRWFPVLINPGKVTALQEAGKWVTVRSNVTSMLAPRLGNISQRLAENRLMAFIQKKLASSPDMFLALERLGATGASQSSRIVQGLTLLGIQGGKGILHTTKFAAIMVLWGGAHHLAYESGIPGLTLLVDLIGEFEVPQQFWRVLKHTGVELKLFDARMKMLAQHLERRKREIQIANEAMEQIVETSQNMRAAERARVAQANAARRGDELAQAARPVDPYAETLSASIDALAGKVNASPGAARHIPQNADEAVEHAMANSMNAMKGGDVAELERATTAAQTFNKTALERAETVSQKLEKAEEIVSDALVIEASAAAPGRSIGSRQTAEGVEVGTAAGAVGRSSGPGMTIADPKVGTAAVQAQGLPGFNTIKHQSNEVLLSPFFDSAHYVGPSGNVIRRADDALYFDEVDQALELYRKAKRLEMELGVYGGPRAWYLEEKIAAILNSRHSKVMWEAARAAAPEISAKVPISLSEEIWVMAQFRKGNYKQISGGRNPLFEVKDETGRRLLVKKLEDAAEMESEVVVPILVNDLGLNAPAARGLYDTGLKIPVERTTGQGRRQVSRTKTETLDFAVIIRPVDDFVELGALHEHDLLALRGDYAGQRVLKSWVADSDGHMRNLLFDRQGRMWVIDHDMASVAESTLRQAGHVPYENNPAGLIEATITFAQGRIPESSNEVVAEMWRASRASHIKKSPLYGAMKRFDQLINYNDMAPMVKKINELKLKEVGESSILQKILEAGIGPKKAKEILEELGKRRGALEPTLNSDRLFGGAGPIQISRLHLLKRLGHVVGWRIDIDPLGGAPHDEAADSGVIEWRGLGLKSMSSLLWKEAA